MSFPPGTLVIIAESGKHDDASRKIVRAQAARASASRSRDTRARNRQLREGGLVEQTHDEAISSRRSSIITASSVEQGIGSSPFRAIQPLRQRPFLHVDDTVIDRYRQTMPKVLPSGFVSLDRSVKLDTTLKMLICNTACPNLHGLDADVQLNDLIRTCEAITTQGPQDCAHTASALGCLCILLWQTRSATNRPFRLREAWLYCSTRLSSMRPACIFTARTLCWSALTIAVTAGTTRRAEERSIDEILGTAVTAAHLRNWQDWRSLLLEYIYPVSLLETAFIRYLRDSGHIT